jgi:hypothetical protein
LGENWEIELSELTTIEAVQKKQTELIKAIVDREKIENENLSKNEKEIQTEVDNAQKFVKGSGTVQEANKLLEKLKDFRNK